MNMRNAMVVMVTLMGALGAVSCKQKQVDGPSDRPRVAEAAPEATSKLVAARGAVYLWIDPRTKCHYLKVGDFLTPRMDQHGHQVCE